MLVSGTLNHPPRPWSSDGDFHTKIFVPHTKTAGGGGKGKKDESSTHQDWPCEGTQVHFFATAKEAWAFYQVSA